MAETKRRKTHPKLNWDEIDGLWPFTSFEDCGIWAKWSLEEVDALFDLTSTPESPVEMESEK